MKDLHNEIYELWKLSFVLHNLNRKFIFWLSVSCWTLGKEIEVSNREQFHRRQEARKANEIITRSSNLSNVSFGLQTGAFLVKKGFMLMWKMYAAGKLS